jgi:hypothetical protein
VISEDAPAGGWIANTAPKTLYVLVIDNSNGTLTAKAYETYSFGIYSNEITDIAAFLTFDNSYITRSINVASLPLLGTKIATGTSLSGHNFKFTITEGGVTVATGSTNGTGTITFTPGSFAYTAPGHYEYVITEDTPLPGDWAALTSPKTIYVQVDYDSYGVLTAKAYETYSGGIYSNEITDIATFLTFYNRYSPRVILNNPPSNNPPPDNPPPNEPPPDITPPKEFPPPSDTTETDTWIDRDEPKEIDDNDTPHGDTGDDTIGDLPQTGLVKWPAYALFITGILTTSVGACFLKRNKKKDGTV